LNPDHVGRGAFRRPCNYWTPLMSSMQIPPPPVQPVTGVARRAVPTALTRARPRACKSPLISTLQRIHADESMIIERNTEEGHTRTSPFTFHPFRRGTHQDVPFPPSPFLPFSISTSPCPNCLGIFGRNPLIPHSGCPSNLGFCLFNQTPCRRHRGHKRGRIEGKTAVGHIESGNPDSGLGQ